MKNDRFGYSAITKDQVTIQAYGTATVQYADISPNYFRVQNMGIAVVLCGTSVMPTENRYDFKVAGESIQMYAEPNKRGRIYIHNPSGSAVTCVVQAFEAPFDPVALAMANQTIHLDTSGMQMSSVISGFNSPLPTGSNTIGKVGLSGAIPAGSNKIGSVSVDNLATLATSKNQEDIGQIIYEGFQEVFAQLTDQNKYVDDTASFSATNKSEDTDICSGGGCVIHMLTNDGTSDLNLVLTGTSDTQTFTLKAGETIQDFNFIGSIKVTGTNYSFRALVSYTF